MIDDDNMRDEHDFSKGRRDLYANRFKNQAEAISAYEAVLDIDPNNALAIVFLREAYEKRRDWEKLVKLRQAEAAGLSSEQERAAAYKEIAKKYKGQNVAAQLEQKVKKGSQGVWGPVPMPPNAAVPDADVKKLVDWILGLS